MEFKAVDPTYVMSIGTDNLNWRSKHYTVVTGERFVLADKDMARFVSVVYDDETLYPFFAMHKSMQEVALILSCHIINELKDLHEDSEPEAVREVLLSLVPQYGTLKKCGKGDPEPWACKVHEEALKREIL